MPTYSFDERSVKRIGDAVRKVERMGGDRNEPPIEYDNSSEGFRTVIRGTFSGTWSRGSDSEVEYIADNGETKTKTATNFFTDVGSAGGTTDCVIMLAGSEWVLVSADPLTECQEVVTAVNTTETSLTFVTGVSLSGDASFITSLSGSVVTNVACVDGNLTVTTASLADLAQSGSFSGSISSSTSSVTIKEIGQVDSQNLTLPVQGSCNGDS